MFLYGLCNGKVHEESTIIEATSGIIATSETYFARLFVLKFITVVTESTSQKIIDLIEFNGGEYLKMPHFEIYKKAQSLVQQTNGYYVNQFTYIGRATDWRGNNNIAESIFDQMGAERFSISA